VVIIGAGAPKDLIALSEQDENFEVLGYVDDLPPHLDKALTLPCPPLIHLRPRFKVEAD
jgi:hypothetical protein